MIANCSLGMYTEKMVPKEENIFDILKFSQKCQFYGFSSFGSNDCFSLSFYSQHLGKREKEWRNPPGCSEASLPHSLGKLFMSDLQGRLAWGFLGSN